QAQRPVGGRGSVLGVAGDRARAAAAALPERGREGRPHRLRREAQGELQGEVVSHRSTIERPVPSGAGRSALRRVHMTYEQTWMDGLNRGDVSIADQGFAPDCIFHMTGSPSGRLAEVKQRIGGLLAAFPDFHIAIEDQVVAGDRVTTRWRAEGTHKGALGPIPPTGKRMQVDGLILDRVEGDRVVERWEQ